VNRRMTGRLDVLEQRAAEQQEELAERIASVMVKVLRDVLDDLDLTAEQRELAKAATPRHLRLMAAGLRAESKS
jgi:hypothetical protein